MAIRLSSSRMDVGDKTFLKPVFKDYGEVLNDMGPGGGTRDIDLTLGNVVTATVSGSTTTFTFSNPSASGTACSFTLILTNGGSQTVNWPAAVEWVAGEAPTLTTSGVDILTFATTDAGATWIGFTGGGGIAHDSVLYAWGLGSSGQLGQGTSAVDRSSPVQVGSLATWAQVSGGMYHTLARGINGTLWAWGLNTNGRLGDGSTTSRSSPVQVGSLATWKKAAAGGGHSVALKSDGTLWAWGLNYSGQLAQGNLTLRSSPVQVGSLATWTDVAAGSYHNLALKSDNTLWAWGWDGGDGRIGDGTLTARSSPVQIGSLANWKSISTSWDHSLAIKIDGTLWSWGDNVHGQLGDGTTTNRSSPVQVGSSNGWLAVSGGYNHTLALKSDNTLWAWGRGSYGRIGDSAYVSRSSPVQIGSLTSWTAINAGMYSSHALRADGTFWSWGGGYSGALGNNSTAAVGSPVQVGSLTSWKTISSGRKSTFSIRRA